MCYRWVSVRCNKQDTHKITECARVMVQCANTNTVSALLCLLRAFSVHFIAKYLGRSLGWSVSVCTVKRNREDDHNWPEPDRVGRQELEVKLGNEHISFTVSESCFLGFFRLTFLVLYCILYCTVRLYCM